MVLCKLSPLLLIMVSVLWKLILIPLLFSWNFHLGIYLFEVSILDLLMSFMDSAPMPLEGSVAPSSPGSSQMADQAGPSNAGLAHSPAGSFPSVPSGLSPIPDDPSIPSVPSLPSLDSNDGEQSVEQRAPRESHPNPVASPGEEAALRTQRERVKAELRLLFQIGYNKRARSPETAEELIQWIGIDEERDPLFLESLYNHLDWLSLKQGGSVGQPQKLSKKGQDELCRWVLQQKEDGAGGPGGDS